MPETKTYRGLEPSKESHRTSARLLIGGIALTASVAAMEGFTKVSDALKDLELNSSSTRQTEQIDVVELGEPQELVVHVEKAGE